MANALNDIDITDNQKAMLMEFFSDVAYFLRNKRE